MLATFSPTGDDKDDGDGDDKDDGDDDYDIMSKAKKEQCLPACKLVSLRTIRLTSNCLMQLGTARARLNESQLLFTSFDSYNDRCRVSALSQVE